MFPTSTLQKNDHSIHYLPFWQHVIHLIQLTCWKANGSTEQARRWSSRVCAERWLIHHVSQEVRDPGQLWVRDTPCCHQEGRGHQHGISIPAQLQDPGVARLLPLVLSTWVLLASHIWQPAFIRSTPRDKLFMWYFSVLYLLTLVKKKVSVHRVLALRQPVWHVFTLNSYHSPRKWACIPF